MIVTPLQMAMVAAGVANGGVVMRPYVVDRDRAAERLARHAHDTEDAEPRDQAADGRGAEPDDAGGRDRRHRQAAQIPGVPVAGKTGTAETGNSGINTTWFIAFAPADHPRVAIAVVLQNQTRLRRHDRRPDRENRDGSPPHRSPNLQ